MKRNFIINHQLEAKLECMIAIIKHDRKNKYLNFFYEMNNKTYEALEILEKYFERKNRKAI